jgi:SAM-dependent methyltransferase
VRETVSRILALIDRVIGRGSYRPLQRRLDPKSEYTQVTYGRVLEKMLGPSARWLDAACGHEILKHGAGTEQIDLCSRARTAVGCDLDLASLRKQHLLTNRVCCDLGALPFKSSSFGVVSLNNVAEHLADPARVFAEFERVLQDGGRLVIHTPNVHSYWALVTRLGRRILPERTVSRLIWFLEYREDDDVFPTVYRANSRQQLLELAARTGMTVERVSFLRSRPLFYFFAPAAVIEMLLGRLMVRLGMEEFAASVLLAVFRRPMVESGRMIAAGSSSELAS